MNIYIPPFWCGVLATLLVEFILFVGVIICISGGKKDGSSKDNNNQGNQ